MNQYFDKNGKQVNTGDIIFYDEGAGFSKGIHTIVMVDGKLWGKTVVYNDDDLYCECDATEIPVSLEHYAGVSYGDQSGKMGDCELIGNITDNPEMLTAEWATEHYPISL